MTFSILAIDRERRVIGVSVATSGLFTGAIVPIVDGDGDFVGVSQAYVSAETKAKCIQLIKSGLQSDQLASKLETFDEDWQYRQLAILKSSGERFSHTGTETTGFAGHASGPNYLAIGNMLTSRQVLDSIESVMGGRKKVSLEERLLEGLKAAEESGGQSQNGKRLRVRSAFLCTVDQSGLTEVDIRVDVHEEAIGELRRLYDIQKSYAGLMRSCQTEPESLSGCEDEDEIVPGAPPIFA